MTCRIKEINSKLREDNKERGFCSLKRYAFKHNLNRVQNDQWYPYQWVKGLVKSHQHNWISIDNQIHFVRQLPLETHISQGKRHQKKSNHVKGQCGLGQVPSLSDFDGLRCPQVMGFLDHRLVWQVMDTLVNKTEKTGQRLIISDHVSIGM